MTEVNQTSPRVETGRLPKRRRSELERLLDHTVLGPTHPELGTCWLFTGTCTPYGRMARAQDSYTHRLGWKLLRGPIPEGKELHHRHPLSANLRIDPRTGARVCRTCLRALWASPRQWARGGTGI
jgi:hypothetical protein